MIYKTIQQYVIIINLDAISNKLASKYMKKMGKCKVHLIYNYSGHLEHTFIRNLYRLVKLKISNLVKPNNKV